MAKARAQVTDPSKVVAYLGLGFTFLMNAAAIGYVYGGVSFRIAAAEERVAKLEKRVDDFNSVATDMAVVKNTLTSISSSLARLEAQTASLKPPGK